MRAVLALTVSAVALAVAFYLAGSFIAASWDITTWNSEGRAYVAVIWLSMSFGLGLMRYLERK